MSRAGLAVLVIGLYVVPPFYAGALLTDTVPQMRIHGLLALGVLAVVLWPRPLQPLDESRPVGRLRRYVAFSVDSIVFLTVYWIGVFAVDFLLEGQAIGSWWGSPEWEKILARDSVGLGLIPVIWIATYYYSMHHLRRGKPTVGQFLLGYRIVALPGVNWRKRLCLGAFALFFWPAGLFSSARAPGVYFWDADSYSRAVSIRKP